MFGIGIEQVVNILTRLDQQTLRVNPRQCTRVRHRRSTCARCADACPTRAITWQGALQVEADKCIGCGNCATVCPTGALEAQTPTNAELLAQVNARAAENRSVTFACPRYFETTHAASAQVVQVKCLGRLDESILCGAIVEGAQAVTLLDGACADCPHAIGRTIAAQAAQTTNALLSAFGVAPRIAFDARASAQVERAPDSVATANGLSRRAFFNSLARETAKVTAVTVNSVLSGQATSVDAEAKLPRGELPKRVPAKHQLLLTAPRKIGKPTFVEWDGSIWAQFGFTEKCNGCQMCAFFCPTGALTKIEQEGKLGVAFRLALCTNCQLCRELCYLDGVTLSPTVDLNKVVNGTVESFLMVDVEAAQWRLSPEERLKKTLSTLGKT